MIGVVPFDCLAWSPSRLAAAALTGSNPFKTMMVTWKYTLPAFLVPFVFTLDPSGMGVLLQAPIVDIVRTSVSGALGVGGLAMAFGGWLRREATVIERVLAGVGGALLFYPAGLAAVAGLAVTGAAVGLHLWIRRSVGRSRHRTHTTG